MRVCVRVIGTFDDGGVTPHEETSRKRRVRLFCVRGEKRNDTRALSLDFDLMFLSSRKVISQIVGALKSLIEGDFYIRFCIQ